MRVRADDAVVVDLGGGVDQDVDAELRPRPDKAPSEQLRAPAEICRPLDGRRRVYDHGDALPIDPEQPRALAKVANADCDGVASVRFVVGLNKVCLLVPPESVAQNVRVAAATEYRDSHATPSAPP